MEHNLGKVGMTADGAYVSTKAYEKLTCVLHNGLSWISTKDVPAGYAPAEGSEYWQKVSEKGEKGDQGERGPQGNSAFDGNGVEIVNNLTQGGEAAVLSAEQGKVLNAEIAKLESEISPLIKMTDSLSSNNHKYLFSIIKGIRLDGAWDRDKKYTIRVLSRDSENGFRIVIVEYGKYNPYIYDSGNIVFSEISETEKTKAFEFPIIDGKRIVLCMDLLSLPTSTSFTFPESVGQKYIINNLCIRDFVFTDDFKDLQIQNQEFQNQFSDLESDVNGIKGIIYSLNLTNKSLVVKGNEGEQITVTESNTTGFGFVKLQVDNGTIIKLKVWGGETSPAYAILDEEYRIISKYNRYYSGYIVIPSNGRWVVVNNNFSYVDSPEVKICSPYNLSKKEFEVLYDDFLESIIEKADFLSGTYIKRDGEIAQSDSWSSYKFDLSKIIPHKIKVYGNNETYCCISFYDKENKFVDGYNFYSTTESTIIDNIVIPSNANHAIISNRDATSIDIEIIGYIKRYTTTNKTIFTNLSNRYAAIYVAADGTPTQSGSWDSWILDADKIGEDIEFYCRTNSTSFYNIAFYSDKPSSNSFLNGLKAGSTTDLSYLRLNKKEIPVGTKYVLFTTRIASGYDYKGIQYTYQYGLLSTIDNKIANIKKQNYTSKHIKNIYANIYNSNDFALIKDELWIGKNVYDNGVATDQTIIHRYKKDSDDNYVYLGQMVTDFGHLNTIDYCEENDCLIFTNSANTETTDGNYFTIVKNPLSLPLTSVSKNTYGISYNVNLGFKVNAVWGDSNLGNHDIIYILSNNAATFTEILLKKNEDGEFNGEMVILNTYETGLVRGINGMAFWGDSIYIGLAPGYRIGVLNVSDLSYREIKRKYYTNEGIELNGSVQGICVNHQYMWVFSNIAGVDNNFLVQYYK